MDHGPPQRDFRAALYEGYVSTFKGHTSSDASRWWDYKYLPLLSDLPRDAAILDIGCGNGALLSYLRQRGFSCARGIDISAEQVALATATGVAAEHGDILTILPTRRETYAAIIAVDVFEHFSRDELQTVAPIIFGALQPRGRLLVQTANGAGLLPGQVIYGDLTHLTIFTPQSLSQLLRPTGFVDLTFFETGPVPIRLRGKLDVLAWRAITTVVATLKYVETGKRQTVWTENLICRAFKP